MANLNLEYLDVYLIHWPLPAFELIPTGQKYPALHKETWRAMREILASGRIKSLGVSNFRQEDLSDLLDSGVVPVLNQIEIHPYLTQKEMIAFCHKHKIAVQAWRPIAGGKAENDTVLQGIAQAHGKNIAQIILRWHLQNDVLVIPKSVTPSRIASNIEIFDFELSPKEMEAIDSLNQGERFGPNPAEFWKGFVVKLS
jgi:diketogulonate reductase-like aldo/keto reductase